MFFLRWIKIQKIKSKLGFYWVRVVFFFISTVLIKLEGVRVRGEMEEGENLALQRYGSSSNRTPALRSCGRIGGGAEGARGASRLLPLDSREPTSQLPIKLAKETTTPLSAFCSTSQLVCRACCIWAC